MHIRAKTKPWGQRNCLKSWDMIVSRHISGEGCKKSLLYWRFRSTVVSIILKWKNFGTTRTLSGAGRPAKQSNLGRKALVREVTKNPVVTLAELHRSCVEMEEIPRRTTITATLHWSWLYGRVARRKPLLSERDMKAHLEFAKTHLNGTSLERPEN